MAEFFGSRSLRRKLRVGSAGAVLGSINQTRRAIPKEKLCHRCRNRRMIEDPVDTVHLGIRGEIRTAGTRRPRRSNLSSMPVWVSFAKPQTDRAGTP
jgi:hypothetical protein